MIHWDDLEPGDIESMVWVEHTVRMLVPKIFLGEGPYTIAQESVDIQSLTHGQMGEPARCPCGQTAIRYGDKYPWGRERYGSKNDNRVPGQYCPHCDGGEDI